MNIYGVPYECHPDPYTIGPSLGPTKFLVPDDKAELIRLPGGISSSQMTEIVRRWHPFTTEWPTDFVGIGGDHCVTYAFLKAYMKLHPRAETPYLISIDAHDDLGTIERGAEFDHGTWLTAALRDGLVQHPTIIGCRTSHGYTTFDMDYIPANDAITALHELRGLGAPFYLTIDMDGFDPACAPGVSFPEQCGVIPNHPFLRALRALVSDESCVGVDLVEYNPLNEAGATTRRLMRSLLETFSLAYDDRNSG